MKIYTTFFIFNNKTNNTLYKKLKNSKNSNNDKIYTTI